MPPGKNPGGLFVFTGDLDGCRRDAPMSVKRNAR